MTHHINISKKIPALKTATMAVFAAVSLSLTACATGGANTVPIIDAPNSPKLQADLAQCQQLAGQKQVLDGNSLAPIAIGTGIGALAGLSSGNRYGRGGNGDDVLVGALIGGVAGTGVAAFQGQNAQADIVYRCMAGRGYRILG